MKKILILICFVLFSMLNLYAQESDLSKLDEVVDQYYPDSQAPGIILQISKYGMGTGYAKGRGIANLETGEQIDSLTNFRMASVSKQFTALAVFLLEANGQLKLTDKIRKYLPTLPEETASVEVQHLLNHSSGLVDYENYIPENQKEQLSDRSVLELISRIDSVYFPAGRQFRYSNTGYCLLALLVEQVSGKSYADFMRDEVFRELDMKHSEIMVPGAQVRNRAFGYHLENGKFTFADQSITSATKGDGGVYTSAYDYARGSTSLIYALQLAEGLVTEYPNLFMEVQPGIRYGFGFFFGMDQHGDQVLFHSGESTGFHNVVLNFPNKKLTISAFSNRDDLQIAPFFQDVLQILEIDIQGIGTNDLFTWLSNVYAHRIH